MNHYATVDAEVRGLIWELKGSGFRVLPDPDRRGIIILYPCPSGSLPRAARRLVEIEGPAFEHLTQGAAAGTPAPASAQPDAGTGAAPEPPPLVMGGQGRSGEEVLEDGLLLGRWVAVGIGALAIGTLLGLLIPRPEWLR